MLNHLLTVQRLLLYDTQRFEKLTQTVKFLGAESIRPFGAKAFGICSSVKPVT